MAARIKGKIDPNGPTGSVIIGPPVSPTAPGPAPSGAVACIFDTGARRTAIKPNVIQALKLKKVGSQSVSVPGLATTTADTYECSIWSAAGDLIAAKAVVCEFAPVGTSALVGQDILGLGVLVHDGSNGTYELTFP